MYETEHPSESTDRPAEFDDRLSVILSSPARKRVIAALNRHGPLTFSELSGFVADADAEATVHASTGDEGGTVVMLHHRDLPKLANHGIVEWVNEPDRVMLTREGADCAASLGL